MEHGHSPTGLTLHFLILVLVPPNKKLATSAANSVVLGDVKFPCSCTVNIKKPWPLVQCTFSVSDNISKIKVSYKLTICGFLSMESVMV